MKSATDRSPPSPIASYRTNGMGLVSERNGVPVSISRRVAGSNASRTDSPQDIASPAWWISSRMTSVLKPSTLIRRASGLAATPA